MHPVLAGVLTAAGLFVLMPLLWLIYKWFATLVITATLGGDRRAQVLLFLLVFGGFAAMFSTIYWLAR